MSETDSKGGSSAHKNPAPPPPNAPTPRASPFDLTSWKAPEPKSDAQPTDKGRQAKRERHPLVHWDQLAGISGLLVTDVWLASSKPKPEEGKPAYDYAGVNVLLPPNENHPNGEEVTVLTGEDTAAGARIKSAFLEGKLDAIFGNPPRFVPVKALNRTSTDPSRKAKPFTILVFGEA